MKGANATAAKKAAGPRRRAKGAGQTAGGMVYWKKDKPRRLRAAGQEVLTMKGSAFRLAGLILGIVASVAAVVAIVLSAVGMSKARQCKHCKLGGHVK